MSKLIQLKKIISIKEAANHLTKTWNEDVIESDILQLGLDHHLTLSVNFNNIKKAKCTPKSFINGVIPTTLSYPESRFRKEILTIDGIWDLLMIGDEILSIRSKIQELADGVKPLLDALKNSDTNYNAGTYLKNEEGLMYQIHSQEDLKEYIEQGEVWPWHGLPDDSVLVVRTSELNRLISTFTNSESISIKQQEKPLVDSERDSLLKIIIGIAIKRYKYDHNSNKSGTPTAIKHDLEQLGIDLDVDTIRKHLKAASAKLH